MRAPYFSSLLKTKLTSLLLLITLLLLSSCASVPTHINISPDLDLTTGTYQFQNSPAWQIDSQDLRIARHLIEIVDGDNVAQLINEQQSLRLLIENNLAQTWATNKLQQAKKSDYKLDIKLIKALATVTESNVSYEVSSEMMIKIQLTYKNKQFAKLFRSNNQWDAAFSTNISRVAEELNLQLSQLLNQIVQDQELNDKLQQF